MGKQYTHFTIEERCELARLHAAGHSHREIAAALDRAPSTIAREVKRNGTQRDGYQARYAQEQALARRWGGGKLERDAALRKTVLEYLQYGWSPEQVAGYLARDAGGRSSRTRPSTVSFTRKWHAPRTGTGGITCRVPSPSAAGVGAEAAVRPPSLPSAVHWRNGPRRRQTAKPPATGRLI